jgi:hypothetical protein
MEGLGAAVEGDVLIQAAVWVAKDQKITRPQSVKTGIQPSGFRVIKARRINAGITGRIRIASQGYRAKRIVGAPG